LLGILAAPDIPFGTDAAKIAGLKLNGSLTEDTGLATVAASSSLLQYTSIGTPARTGVSATGTNVVFSWSISGFNGEFFSIDLPAGKFPASISFWTCYPSGLPGQASNPCLCISTVNSSTSITPMIALQLYNRNDSSGLNSLYVSFCPLSWLNSATHTAQLGSTTGTSGSLGASDSWSHVVATLDAVGSCRIFINGVGGTTIQSGVFASRTSGSVFRLSILSEGGYTWGFSDLRVFDQPLTNAQAAGLYDGSWNP
jgi:hypothetical protein